MMSNMRISHRIGVLIAGLLIGFVIIALAFFLHIKFHESLRDEEYRALNFENSLTEIGLLNLQLQASTQQAILSSRSSAFDAQKTLHGSLSSRLAENKDDAALFGVTAQISDVEKLLNQFQASFTRLLREREAFGYTDALGLRNELSNIQNNLLLLLQENDLTQSMEYLIGIKANTLEYFNAVDDHYLKAVIVQSDKLKIAVSEANASIAVQENVEALLAAYMQAFRLSSERLKSIRALASEVGTFGKNITTKFEAIQKTASERSSVIVSDAVKASRHTEYGVLGIIAFIAAITSAAAYSIYRSIHIPMNNMQEVIKKINSGKTASRMNVSSKDELGDLARAFNKLFNERIQRLEEQSKENDILNNSIIALIRALGLITRKDLTIKVPVSPDITGTISDAVNLLTSETAKTLREVKNISNEVNRVSEKLQDQSGVVIQFAENERRQIIATSKTLEILARAMSQIAINSEEANVSASQAIEYTQSARQTVERTVTGIRGIRETISETEKRMKRLGDRSQEISGIVNLINTIAERTHILALNASMHAASAGEAGKGFAVVADEVKRLAESSREATDDIASMVNNIRIETADTLNVINRLISQVAEESKMAEQAGLQMTDTESATLSLVETVQDIAQQAAEQAEVANRVRDRATIIRDFTEKTGTQLAQQQSSSQHLKECAATLVKQVNEFILPEEQSEVPSKTVRFETVAG